MRVRRLVRDSIHQDSAELSEGELLAQATPTQQDSTEISQLQTPGNEIRKNQISMFHGHNRGYSLLVLRVADEGA